MALEIDSREIDKTSRFFQEKIDGETFIVERRYVELSRKNRAEIQTIVDTCNEDITSQNAKKAKYQAILDQL